MLSVEGVTHWSIPVNNLDEAERFYRDLLGLEYKGRLPGGAMACVGAGDHNILLCQRNEPTVRTREQDGSLHHSFIVRPEVLEEACAALPEKGIAIRELVYREKGFFLGRELYFEDPFGNQLELRDPTWTSGMPTPSHENIAAAFRQKAALRP